MRRVFAVALTGLCVTACAATDRMLAPRADYAQYREFRLAGSRLERLRHGNRYLKDHPDGRFRAEVDAWFRVNEAAFLEQAHDRPSLLRAYLGALPDGPHAEQVIDRLIELEMLRQYRDRRVQQEQSKLQSALDAVERAQASRQQAVNLLTRWIRLLSDVRSFGQPTSALPVELQSELQAGEPPMHCSDQRCEKRARVPYAIPGRGALLDREMAFDVTVELERGLVRAVSLSGPDLFSRLAETLSLSAVEASDFGARVDAIARSVALVANVIEPRFPQAQCGKDVVAPTVLERLCDGARFEVWAGSEPGKPDGLRVSAAPTADGRKKTP